MFQYYCKKSKIKKKMRSKKERKNTRKIEEQVKELFVLRCRYLQMMSHRN